LYNDKSFNYREETKRKKQIIFYPPRLLEYLNITNNNLFIYQIKFTFLMVKNPYSYKIMFNI